MPALSDQCESKEQPHARPSAADRSTGKQTRKRNLQNLNGLLELVAQEAKARTEPCGSKEKVATSNKPGKSGQASRLTIKRRMVIRIGSHQDNFREFGISPKGRLMLFDTKQKIWRLVSPDSLTDDQLKRCITSLDDWIQPDIG